MRNLSDTITFRLPRLRINLMTILILALVVSIPLSVINADIMGYSMNPFAQYNVIDSNISRDFGMQKFIELKLELADGSGKGKSVNVTVWEGSSYFYELQSSIMNKNIHQVTGFVEVVPGQFPTMQVFGTN